MGILAKWIRRHRAAWVRSKIAWLEVELRAAIFRDKNTVFALETELSYWRKKLADLERRA